jgi:DNA-directed RNA polymerase subunit RPC12/RpoP
VDLDSVSVSIVCGLSFDPIAKGQTSNCQSCWGRVVLLYKDRPTESLTRVDQIRSSDHRVYCRKCMDSRTSMA